MMRRILVLRSILICLCLSCGVWSQDDAVAPLVNGNMEETKNERPVGWNFSSPSRGAILKLENKDPFKGNQSVLIDALAATSSTGMTANLSQSIDAKGWQGKRVRLRAAIKTADLESDAKAQMWFRVDRPAKNSRPTFGSFDNMGDRPITELEWKHYDIVLDVDADAEKFVLGVFVMGKGKAWIDDITLTEASNDTPVTGKSLASVSADNVNSKKAKNSQPSSRFQRSPVLVKAMQEAENAPRQSFFTPWLWPALIAIVLFALSAQPAQTTEFTNRRGQLIQKPVLNAVAKFSIRFSTVYWLLYSLPGPFNYLVVHLGKDTNLWFQKIFSWYSTQVTTVVNWVASNLFRISHELVPPNGSGDTTFNYIQVFVVFLLALIVAALWSAIDWRKTDHRHVKDLLRSYLRYVLAVTMLGYGLAKVAWDSNQFPSLGEHQLNRTWGDSSPMGVLWSFMGASQAYTIFAGMGEVVGGTLLLFRRTTLLGCFVVLGVMTNVMMLNYCYDVPVKLYSTHLIFMAIFLMLPSAGRLANLLLFNRAVKPVDLSPSYTNGVTIWLQRLVKIGLIGLAFGIPIYKHVHRQMDYFEAQAKLPEYFESFEVVEFKLNGKPVSSNDSNSTVWKSVKIDRMAYNEKMERVSSNWISIRMEKGSAAMTFSTADEELSVNNHSYPTLPQGPIELVKNEDGTFLLSGKIAAGKVEAKLKKQSGQHRLTHRGFRWINEVPFNR